MGKEKILGRGEINIYHKEEEVKAVPPKGGERKRDVISFRSIIHPNNPYRRSFDFCSVLLVGYLMWKIPFDIAFDWNENSDFEGFILGVIDFWFAIDIMLNFKTGFLKNGTAVMHRKKVFNHYLYGWFLIDLLGTVPFELFVSSNSGASNSTNRKTLKLAKYFKIPKLLRISRVLKYFRAQKHVFDLVKVFLLIIVSIHMGACVWVQALAPCPLDGDIHKLEFVSEFPHCNETKVYDLYAESFHISTSMILGVSNNHLVITQGELTTYLDTNIEGKQGLFLLSIVYMIYGLYMASLLFSEMSVYIAGKTQGSSAFQQKVDRVRHEFEYYNVPTDLQNQVKAYHDYIWINQKQYDDSIGLLSDKQMSTDLQRKLALHLYKDVVMHISFFAHVDDTVLGQICLSLKTLIFLPYDMILFKGDVGKELFIIAKGVVEVLRDDLPPEKRKDANIILLRSGSFFGEIALVMEVRRTCSVMAKTVCEINILMQRTFDDILREHPDFARKMNELVVARQLETSIATAHGRTQGSMKVRQSDLNFANKSVEKKMKAGLDRRASRRKTIVKTSGQMEALFPEGGPHVKEADSGTVELKSLRSYSEKRKAEDGSEGREVKETVSDSGNKPGTSDDLVSIDIEKLGGNRVAKSPELHEGSDTGGDDGIPIIEKKISFRHAPIEEQHTNIFDDLERRKSLGEDYNSAIKEANDQDARDHVQTQMSLGRVETGSGIVDVSKVHSSILAGGEGSSKQNEQKIHSRLSNTERMLHALMNKLDIKENDFVDVSDDEDGSQEGEEESVPPEKEGNDEAPVEKGIADA